MRLDQALEAVTGTRRVGLCFPFPRNVFKQRVGQCQSVTVMQRLVYFSAHPKVMQQHGQLSRRGNPLTETTRAVYTPVIRGCPFLLTASQQRFFTPNVAKPEDGTPPVSPRMPVPIASLLALAGANITKPAASPVDEPTTKFTKILLPMT